MKLMNLLVYIFAGTCVAMVQALPLTWVARLGRFGGEFVFWIDVRHRRMARTNLTRCFGSQMPAKDILALARENFRRIGENYCCAVKSAVMSDAEMDQVLEVRGAEQLQRLSGEATLASRVLATGHFGNFELLARLNSHAAGFRCAATYRGVRPEALERLLYSLRTKGGALFFERRSGAEELKRAMNQGGLLLVLVCDQSARDCGLEVSFLGHNCFASRAPAVMAARYGCPLFVPICYRTGLGRWLIEIGDPIPTTVNGRRRRADDVTRDINLAFEAGVRRDPANWFWVHNRWKARATPQPEPVGESVTTTA